MTEEGRITMTEFKTVVEGFRSDIKKVVEAMNHGFEKVGKEMQSTRKDIQGLKSDNQVLKIDVKTLKTDMHSVKEQIGLLLEGQTEIRAGLKERVTIRDFAKLDKRVTRLEKKIA